MSKYICFALLACTSLVRALPQGSPTTTAPTCYQTIDNILADGDFEQDLDGTTNQPGTWNGVVNEGGFTPSGYNYQPNNGTKLVYLRATNQSPSVGLSQVLANGTNYAGSYTFTYYYKLGHHGPLASDPCQLAVYGGHSHKVIDSISFKPADWPAWPNNLTYTKRTGTVNDQFLGSQLQILWTCPKAFGNADILLDTLSLVGPDVSHSPPAPGPELIQNGGFEVNGSTTSSPASWTRNSSVMANWARASDPTHNNGGNWLLAWTLRGKQYNDGRVYQNITGLTIGKQHLITFSSRLASRQISTPVDDGSQCNLFATATPIGGTKGTSITNSFTTPSSSWSLNQFTWTPDSTAATIAFEATCPGSWSAAQLNIDGVSVQRPATAAKVIPCPS